MGDVQQFSEMTPVLFVKKANYTGYMTESMQAEPVGLFPTPDARAVHREVLAVSSPIAWHVIFTTW